jgi:SAM-dependent methyltransferase
MRDYRSAGACLDIGAGFGTLMVFCRLATGADVFGLDFDPVYMTDGLRSMEGIEWAQANVELDPLPWDGPFDFIVFSEVLEHLNFQSAPTLRKMAATLVEGGRIYLSTPDAASWGKTTKYHERYEDLPQPSEHLRGNVIDDHIWQFSYSELLAVIEESGLEILRMAHAPGSSGGRHFNVTLAPTHVNG